VPKLKTHRGAAKRFKLTSGGKIKRIKAYAGHILTKKTTKRKRGLRQATYVHNSDSARVKMLLPYD
jgi:large subunit ribosomal protein L35